MKFKRSFILILILLCSSIGLLAGCGDKFSKLSATIDKQEVNVYFEEKDDKKTSEDITVSLRGLPKDSSAVIFANMENPDVANIIITTNEETDTSVISVSPKLGGSTNVSLIHKDSNKKLGQIKINAIREVVSISQQDYSSYVLCDGTNNVTYLDSGKLIEFNPINTTQKEIEYSIASSDAINGVSVTKNGALTVSSYPTSGYVYVTATVKDTNVSTRLQIKVLNPILKDDISVQILKNGRYENLDTNNELLMINNRATSSEHTIKTLVNYNYGDELEISYDVENKNLIATQMINDEELIIIAGQNTGETNLVVNVKVKNYDLSYKLLLPIKVIEVPSQIKINNNYESSQNYNIYDKYVNSNGQEFNVEVGLSTANSLDYILVVNNQDANKIDILYESGEPVVYNNTINDQTLYKIESNKFYVKAKQGFDTNAKIMVYALGGIGLEENPVCTTLNLSLRKGVESIKVNTALNNNVLYVEKGTTKNIDFSILNKDGIATDVYSDIFEITSSENGILEHVSTINGKTMQYEYSFNVTGTNEGITDVKIYASNGTYTTIKVRVYSKLTHFTLSVDSFVDNPNIANTEYTQITDTNDKTLTEVAIGLNSFVQIYLNKYNDNGVANSVLVEKVEYTSSNSNYVTVSPTGMIFTRNSTPWNEGDANFKYETITCRVYYYTENGVEQSDLLQFKVYVFKNINNVQITENNIQVIKVDLYSYKEKLFYYDDLMEKTLSYRLNPSYATHYTVDSWQIVAGTNLNFENVDKNTIKISSYYEGDDKQTSTIQIAVKQFNKKFYQNVLVNIIPINEIDGFSNVYYKPDNSTKQMLRTAGQEYDNEDLDKGRNVEKCLGEIYLDYRDIDSSIKINFAYTPNNSTFNDVMLYAQTLNGSQVIELIDNNNFYAKNEGIAKVYLIPLTKFTTSKEITKDILKDCFYAYVKVAGGSTADTALELSSVSDLIRMNNLDSLQSFRYYKLINNIDVSAIKNWNCIGSTNNLGFSGVILGENRKITGISFNAENYEKLYFGFISKLNANSKVENLTIEIEKFNLSARSADKLQTIDVGGLCGLADTNVEITNCNVVIKNSNIVLNYRTGINFGGLVGNSNATITGSKSTVNVVISKEGSENVNRDLTFNIGGFVGLNNGQITGSYGNPKNEEGSENKASNKVTLEDLLLSNNLDVVSNIQFINNYNGTASLSTAIGGVVGLNNSSISNISASPVVISGTTKAKTEEEIRANNVGGLIGLNKAQVTEVVVLLKNYLSQNQYLSAISGTENVGGLIGTSENADITSGYVFALDNSNYYKFKGTLQPQIVGVNNVGGIIGSLNGGSLKQSYISSYFKRNLGEDTQTQSTYLGTIGLSVNQSNNMAGIVANANNSIVTECFANIDIYSQQGNTNVKGFVSANNNCNIKDSYIIIDTNIDNFSVGNTNIDNYYYVIIKKYLENNEVKEETKEFSNININNVDSKFEESSDENIKQINAGKPVLKNVVYLGQPNSIDASVQSNYKFTDTYGYLQTGDYGWVNVINYSNNKDSFINIFSSDTTVLSYSNEKLQALTAGNAVLTITSLLNNTLQTEINIKVINKIIDSSFKIYKDADKSAEQTEEKISLNIHSSEDLFVGINAEDGSDYFKKNNDDNNKFVYSAQDLLLKISVKSELVPTFTINGLSWQQETNETTNQTTNETEYYVFVDPTQKFTIIADEYSEETTLTLTLGVKQQIDGTQYFKEFLYRKTDSEELVSLSKTIKVSVNYRITDVIVDTSSIELDAINNSNVKVIVETDKTLTTDEVNLTLSYSKEDENTKTPIEDGNSGLFIVTRNTATDNNIATFDLNIKVNTASGVYTQLTKEDKYILTITVKFNGQTETKTILITIKPQQIENISLDFYSYGEMVKQGTENIYSISENPSNNVIAGSMGILKIHTYPENTKISQIKLQYSTNTPYELQLSQMLLFKGTIGESYKKYYTAIKPNAIAINNGIQFTKTYAYAEMTEQEQTDESGKTVTKKVITTKTDEYDGYVFAGVSLGSSVPENNEFTLTATITTENGKTYTKSITLTSVLKSSMTINNSNVSGEYFAIGVEKEFTLKTTKLIDNNSQIQKQIDGIKFSLTYETIPLSSRETTNKDGNKVITFVDNSKNQVAQITFKNYSLSGNSCNITYSIKVLTTDVLKSYVLSAKLARIVNGLESVYSTENTLTINPVYYSIDGIGIDIGSGGSATARIAIGEVLPLQVKINLSYDGTTLNGLLDDSSISDDIKSKIRNFETFSTTISKKASSWYVYGTENYVQYDGNPTDEYKENYSFKTYYSLRKAGDNEKAIDENGNEYSLAGYYLIQGKKSNVGLVSNMMSVGFYYNYIGGVPTIKYTNIYDENNTDNNSDLKAMLEFNVYVYDSGDIANAVPISSLAELLAMEEGGYYRLTRDITVDDPFTPITTKVACLDGNGYTITLKGGFDTALLQPDTVTDADGNETESAQAKDVNLGLFETLDEDMKVYSLTVKLPYLIKDMVTDADGNSSTTYNNFDKYNLNTLNIGYIAGLNNGVIYNCQAITVQDNNNTEITTNTATTLNFGGIVGENGSTGYITYSRSNVIAKFNRGNVGGLVGVNNNVIASSYFKAQYDSDKETVVLSNNPQTEDNSSLGGFVAINNGQIRTSYVEGYGETKHFDNGYLQSSISIGGFVSKNNGSIEDCYTNIPIYGNTQTSGFVFDNAGTITRCVAYSKMIAKQDDHTPFVGTRNAGKQVLNTGTITDSYYLEGEYSSRLLEVAGVTRVDSLTFDNLKALTKGIWSSDTTFIVNKVDKNNFADFRKKGLLYVKEDETDNYLKVDTTSNFAGDKTYYCKIDYLTLVDANDIKTYQVACEDKFSENKSQHIWNFASKKAQSPYVIASAEEFNKYFDDKNNYNQNEFDFNLRIVRDIEFSKQIQPSSADKTINNRKLQGTGMTLNNIYLVGNNADKDNYGLFKEIKSSTITNLNLSVARLYSNNTKSVGTLAGKVSGGSLINITVSTGEAVIQGVNYIGGLAGTIFDVDVDKVTVQANVNASYFKQSDKINTVSLYNTDKADTYSYAGSLFGLVLDDTVSNASNASNASNINNISVIGSNKISSYYAGGVVGYLGKKASLTDVNVSVNANSYIVGKWISGGIVAHAKQSTIQNATLNYEKDADGKEISNSDVNYFRGSPKIIGGIVGLGNNATITNNTNYVDVINEDSTVAGGIVGVMVYGSITGNTASCNVTAITTAGGIVGSLVPTELFNDSNLWFSKGSVEEGLKNKDNKIILVFDNNTFNSENVSLSADSKGNIIGSYYEKDTSSGITEITNTLIGKHKDNVGSKLNGTLDSISTPSASSTQTEEDQNTNTSQSGQ